MRRAQIKVKLLTGSYIRQTVQSSTNIQFHPCACYVMSHQKHFLFECLKLQPVRVGNVSETEQMLLQVAPDGAAQLLADTEMLYRTIIDFTVLGESISGEFSDGFEAEMEALSRNLCFALYLKQPHY